LKGWLPISE
jgi:hypothetical protein